MSMQDPIADMLVRIKNGQKAEKLTVTMPASKKKAAIAKLLEDEGYILGFEVSEDKKPEMTVKLKYFDGKPVIDELNRISKPSRRVYKGKDELPEFHGGLGTIIVSTSSGIKTAKQAEKDGQGGELIAAVM